MIKFQNIQVGDYVLAEYEGKMWEGEVIELQSDQRLVNVQTDVQSFWFEPEHLCPLPLNEDALLTLNFIKRTNTDGSVK